MGKHVAHTTQFLRPQWLVVAAAVALLSYGMPLILETLPKQPPSSKKSHGDIGSFWPQYMREHQNETAVSLHVTGTSIIILLLLANPELLGAGILAIKCGQLAFAVFRHLDHGLPEALVVLAVYFLTNKFLGGKTRVALVALLIGYAFAWAGHFFFEKNKPATFIYPTFSLVCDFVMWAETITGVSISF